MKNEIERKFLVKTLPDLTGKERVTYERHSLFYANGIELRIQKKGSRFELERKVFVNEFERTREKLEITEAEFMTLKSLADDAIIRDGYILSTNPEISLKKYHGKFEGLVRVEVEFESLEEAKRFGPPEWFGKEITHTPLARDADIRKLSLSEFHSLLADHKIR